MQPQNTRLDIMEIIIQKIHKKYKGDFELAKKYYQILFILNDFYNDKGKKVSITESELNLIAFSSIKGTISTPPVREEFIKEFNVPIGSVYNMSAKLQKLGIFVKEDEKIRIHPSINHNFQNNVALVIKMEHE